MGYLWNKASREPQGTELTHLVMFGKIGTGSNSIMFDGITSVANIAQRRVASLTGTPDWRTKIDAIVAKGKYAWAIGKNNITTQQASFFINTSYNSNLIFPNYYDFSNIPNYSSGIKCQFAYNPSDPYNGDYFQRIKEINTNIMAAGGDHFLAYSGNTLFAWGANTYGQCNVPSNIHSSVTQVSAGDGFSIALLAGGSLTGWGRNDLNQINIPGGLTAKNVDSGLNHSIALKNDGTVICWGDNTFNQCTVPGGLTGVTAIGVGLYHTMAIRENGTVECWGLNTSGQCNVPAGITNGKQIAGGLGHTILLKQDGKVIGWGNNTFKQASGPDNPEILIAGTEYDSTRTPLFYNLKLAGAVKKIACTENASYALHLGKTNVGVVAWNGFPNNGITNWVAPVRPFTFTDGGYTSANYPSGLSFYCKREGYNPVRHDLFVYSTQPTIANQSVWPISWNTNWWFSGTTTERKLNKCFASGYDQEGFMKVYDAPFSPPDFSGCSLRPRQLGAPWAGGVMTEQNLLEKDGELGYYSYHEPHIWQLKNSGFWTNILITKKHAIASKHFSGPNVNLYNVQWLRRDGKFITKNLTRISDLRFTYSDGTVIGPDMVLYELDEELTTGDLDNISIYNIFPKLSGFTGSKKIDTSAYLWKGFTYDSSVIPYEDSIFMGTVGRRVWYIDGNSKVYSHAITTIKSNTGGFAKIISNSLNRTVPYASYLTPDDVDCAVMIGDSGTPVFITAANRLNKTEQLEASYFAGQGTTWGRTFFLGLFDAGVGEWSDEFIQKINTILIGRGLTGSDLLQKIDIDSVGPGNLWTAPITSPTQYPINYSELSNNNSLYNNPDVVQDYLIGEATVVSWDSNNNILEIDGVSGSFDTSGFTYTYTIENGSCSGVLYENLQQYIQPINNGMGTTAGINEEIDEEAELFDVDKNKPC